MLITLLRGVSRPLALAAPRFRAPARSFASVFARAEVSQTKRLLSLNDLRDNAGAIKNFKRVGRGPGSGLGKTCGKGHKGIYQRRSLGKRGFEGGPTPLWKRTPKRGFIRNPKLKRKMQLLNLDKLMMWIRNGRLDPSKTMDIKTLYDSGIFGNAKIRDGVKLLAIGESAFRREYQKLGCEPPKMVVTDVSENAKGAIEALGGKVDIQYMARLPLRAHLHPDKFEIMPRGPGVPPRKLREKYGYVLPADRIYTGKEKKKIFPNRV